MTYASNRITLEIEWAHCDPAGIVWNRRISSSSSTPERGGLFQTVLGVPRGAMLNTRYGLVGIAVVEAGANFMIPLKFGDTAELETTLTEFGRTSFALRYRVHKTASWRSRARNAGSGPRRIRTTRCGCARCRSRPR